MSCGNSVAATVHEAYWRPLHLSMTSKPQVRFSLKTQSPSTLEWRLSVKVSHVCRFERTVTLAHTNRPHGQSPLPERGRATSYVDARGRLPYASPRILNNLGRAAAHPYRTNLGRAGAHPYRYANANLRLDPSIRYR
jgi:hypothetical protein